MLLIRHIETGVGAPPGEQHPRRVNTLSANVNTSCGGGQAGCLRAEYLLSRRLWLRQLAIASGILLAALAGFLSAGAPACGLRSEIFEGITYGCEKLELTEEGSGLLHWVRV